MRAENSSCAIESFLGRPRFLRVEPGPSKLGCLTGDVPAAFFLRFGARLLGPGVKLIRRFVPDANPSLLKSMVTSESKTSLDDDRASRSRNPGVAGRIGRVVVFGVSERKAVPGVAVRGGLPRGLGVTNSPSRVISSSPSSSTPRKGTVTDVVLSLSRIVLRAVGVEC